MTAKQASDLTGLDARLIERPDNGDTTLCSIADPWRAQLGKRSREKFEVTSRDFKTGEMITERGIGDVFTLVAYGANFEQAVRKVTEMRLAEENKARVAKEQAARALKMAMTPTNGDKP